MSNVRRFRGKGGGGGGKDQKPQGGGEDGSQAGPSQPRQPPPPKADDFPSLGGGGDFPSGGGGGGGRKKAGRGAGRGEPAPGAGPPSSVQQQPPPQQQPRQPQPQQQPPTFGPPGGQGHPGRKQGGHFEAGTGAGPSPYQPRAAFSQTFPPQQHPPQFQQHRPQFQPQQQYPPQFPPQQQQTPHFQQHPPQFQQQQQQQQYPPQLQQQEQRRQPEQFDPTTGQGHRRFGGQTRAAFSPQKGGGRGRGDERGGHAGPPGGFQGPPSQPQQPTATPVQAPGGGQGRGWGRGTPSPDPTPSPQFQRPVEPTGPPPGGDRGGGGRGGKGRGRGGRPEHQQQQQREQPYEGQRGAAASGHVPVAIGGDGDSAASMPAQSPPPPQPAQKLIPVTKAAIQAVTQKMSKANVSTCRIPQRKNLNPKVVGTKGRPIQLALNHLSLNFGKPNLIAIHYDVSFEPEKPRRMYRPVMIEFQKQYYPNNFPAFDGRKNLYSAKELPFGREVRGKVSAFNDERSRDQEFEVVVKFASKVDMSSLQSYLAKGTSMNAPQEALQAVDIVLRNPASLRFVSVGRSFFTPPGEKILDLGEGMELWYGFYQSAILGWKPFLNVDVAHKGFPSAESLTDVVCRVLNCKYQDLKNLEMGPREIAPFDKYVRGLKVEYQLPNQPNTKRTYKVNKTLGPAIKERFTLEKDGREIVLTVGEYFERHKNWRLQYPYLPCVHVGPPLKQIYLPIELCRVAKGQAVMRKLTENQTANMVKAAARPPNERKQRIMDAMRRANFNADRCVQEFGISVADRFTEVSGRVLQPPNLLYNNQRVVKPVKGVWRADKFLQPIVIDRWAIVNCDKWIKPDQVKRFASDFSLNGRNLGCNISPNPIMEEINSSRWDARNKNMLESMFKRYKETGVQLILVIIPDRGETYAVVKQIAELTIGILTQCVKSRTMGRMNPATIGNILLKVNAKLNGVNHGLTGNRPLVLTRPCMIVGADVTHPSPDQKNIPSVAAVAASHDPKAFSYNMLWRLQPARMEIIQDLEEIMKAQLLFFYKRTNCKPETIFFYRDGVSEGQFSQVLDHELNALHKACKAMGDDFEPKITFLVVQKRHHTRFFPVNDADKDGKFGNVPAGTIVDTTITHPTEMDFYLVSHASIQGTSRPTKYHMLWDDNQMEEDVLEELTYYLCHLFTRCTRSVSYPAPTYYAHLAAFRARVYLEGNPSPVFENLKLEMDRRTIRDDFLKKTPMFFV